MQIETNKQSKIKIDKTQEKEKRKKRKKKKKKEKRERETCCGSACARYVMYVHVCTCIYACLWACARDLLRFCLCKIVVTVWSITFTAVTGCLPIHTYTHTYTYTYPETFTT